MARGDSTLGLLFEIAADPAKAVNATTTFRNQTDSAIRDVESSYASLAQQTLGISTRMAGYFAIAAGGIAAVGGAMLKLSLDAAELGDKIGDLSAATGLSTQMLSGLNAITFKTDESFDALSQSLARLGVNIQKAIKDPAGEAAESLRNLMGSAKAVADLGLLPMDERIQTVLRHIYDLRDEGARNLALQQQLGRGYMQVSESLSTLVREGIDPAIEASKKLGIYYDEAAARRASEFKEQWKQLNNEFTSLGRNLGQYVLPAMSSLVMDLNRMITATSKEIDYIAELIVSLAKLESAHERSARFDKLGKIYETLSEEEQMKRLLPPAPTVPLLGATGRLAEDERRMLEEQEKAKEKAKARAAEIERERKAAADRAAEEAAKHHEAELIRIRGEGAAARLAETGRYDEESWKLLNARFNKELSGEQALAKARMDADAALTIAQAMNAVKRLQEHAFFNEETANLETQRANRTYANQTKLLEMTEFVTHQMVEQHRFVSAEVAATQAQDAATAFANAMQMMQLNADVTRDAAINAEIRKRIADDVAQRLYIGHVEEMRRLQEMRRELGRVNEVLGLMRSVFSALGRETNKWATIAINAAGAIAEAVITANDKENQSLIAQALLKAKMHIAAAFGSKATFNFWSAAMHTAAAAAYGAAALAPIVAPALGGGGGGGGGGTAVGQEGAMTRTPAMAAGTAGPSGNVQVVVLGSADAAAWMAGVINQGVRFQGVQLTASNQLGSG